MRLKFWEEAIDKCYSKDPQQVPRHPVAIELYKVIRDGQVRFKSF